MPFLPPLISKLFLSSNAPNGNLPTDVLRCVERGAAKDLAALHLPEHVFFQCASSGSGQPTVWHIAAERGDVEVLNRLHTAYSSLPNTTPSSSPNNSRSPVKAYCVQDKQGRTPLMVACQHGNVQCAAALISWGADASKERDRRGRLPIHLVAQAGRLDLLQLILLGLSGPSLQPSPPPGPQPQTLPRVPSRKDEEASSRTTSAPTPAGVMSNSGGQTGGGGSLSPSSQQTTPHQMPNKTLSQQQRITDYSRYMACAVDECGLTPLHYAAASNSLPVCQLLLDCGANVAAVSSVACYDNLLPCNAGMTPLHIAAMSNSFKVAHLMLTVWNMQSLEEKLRNWSPSSSPAPNSKGLAGDNDSSRKNYGGSNGAHSNGGDGDGISRKRALPTQAAGGITDPRTILDKERKAAYMLAYARGYDALGELLDPVTPLPGGHTPDGLIPPSILCCPITMDLMQDPVVASDGYTYERAAIEKWMISKETSPMSNVAFTYKVVFPNRALRQCINEWRVQNGLPEYSAEPTVLNQGPSKQRMLALGRTGGLMTVARIEDDIVF